MQKFTRALTREVELAGERLALTLDEQGITVRPVGSRKPPHHMSWSALLCHVTGPNAGHAPTPEQVAEAVKLLKTTAPAHPAPAPMKEAPSDEAQAESEVHAASGSESGGAAGHGGTPDPT